MSLSRPDQAQTEPNQDQPGTRMRFHLNFLLIFKTRSGPTKPNQDQPRTSPGPACCLPRGHCHFQDQIRPNRAQPRPGWDQPEIPSHFPSHFQDQIRPNQDQPWTSPGTALEQPCCLGVSGGGGSGPLKTPGGTPSPGLVRSSLRAKCHM